MPTEPAEIQRTAEHALCLAPEQAKGEPGDARSDVYALAVMLYQMLTGRPPFFADTFAATLELHLSGGATPPSALVNGIPAGLDEALLRALERDPRRRTPSPEAVLGSLDPLWATGQHQTASKGRIRALTSGELRLEDLEQQGAASDDAEAAGALSIPELRIADLKPKRRRWLFVALAAAVLVFGGAMAFVLLDDDAEEIVPAASPRPAAGRRAPRLKRSAMPKRVVSPRTAPATPPAPRAPAAQPSGVRAPAAPAQNAPGAPATGERSAIERPPLATLAGRKALRPALRALRGLRQPVAGGPAATDQPGTLVLTSSAPNAQFYLDGRLVGDGQRRVLYRIPPGPHQLQVKVNGHASPVRPIVLQPGQKLDVAF